MAGTFDDDRKLRRAADGMAKLGIAQRSSFDQKDKPGIIDPDKVNAAISSTRKDMEGQKALPANATMDEFLTVLDKTVAAQSKAAPASMATTTPAAQHGQAEVRNDDNRIAAAAAAATATPKKPEAATPAAPAAPAQPKPRSAEELKTEEAQAYLRVLGKKDLGEFRADNILNGGADLKGKELTSPEVLAALKARVTGSPEAAKFAEKMAADYDKATKDAGGKPVVLANDDARALQYALVANGKQLNQYGIDGKMGSETLTATRALLAKTPAPATPAAATPATTPPAQGAAPQTQAQVPAAPVRAPSPAPAQTTAGLQVDGGVPVRAPVQQPQQPAGRPVSAEEWVGAAPMTAQPPAGVGIQPYPQPVLSPGAIQLGNRGAIAPVFTGQAAGGIMGFDPRTGTAYNPYTGQYQYANPNTGHFLNPTDRNRDGMIDRREYTAAVNADNLQTNGTYRTGGNVRGMMPVLSQWTGGYPDVRERAYARQDGIMTQRQVQMGYGDIGRGVAAVMDRNRYNDGAGYGALVQGALRIFDPFGQQTPRGPRF